MKTLTLIKPYRRLILLILACIFLSNILALSLPWGIKLIIDTVLTGAGIGFVHRVLVVLLAVLVLRTVLIYFQKYLSALVGERIVADLRHQLYEHVHRVSLVRLRQMSPSQIMTRITSDVDSVRRFIFGDALDCVYGVFSVAAIVLVLGCIHWRMTLCVLGFLPLFGIVYFKGVPDLKGRYSLLRDAYGKLTSRINEVLGGMSTVRAFSGAGYEQRVFDEGQKKVYEASRGVHALNAALWVGAEFFTSAAVIAVLWIGSVEVSAGRITPGGLVAFYSYLGMLFAPLIRMVAVNGTYQEASAAFDRIADVLKVNDGLPLPVAPVVLADVRGEVSFDAVSFGYTSQRRVLNKITFNVMPGETVAIIGPSGVGKTTLVGLLLRLFDVSEGRILVDGHDLRAFSPDQYRQKVSVVLQDDFLFQDSVAANIAYACPGVTRERIERAAKAAQAHDFITALAQGYDTNVGERGALLSCGQRQRIAIARALVRDPGILLLDEATSAVDAMTENSIQKALKAYGRKKTVFIVAHRFSTIMEADRVIVLREGCLEDSGTHEELLVRSSFYRQLYNEQFKGSDACDAGLCADEV